MQRVDDPAYVARSWLYLAHPFFVLMAALGIAMRIRRMASAAAVVGLLGFVLWAFTEAAQQTMTLFAFDAWRAAYAAADELTRSQIRVNTQMYDGLWNAMYFLLLLGFAIGNACFGFALLRGSKLSKLTGAFLLAAFALTLTNIASEFQWTLMPPALSAWAYPAIQPLGRLVIAVWLWRHANEDGELA